MYNLSFMYKLCEYLLKHLAVSCKESRDLIWAGLTLFQETSDQINIVNGDVKLVIDKSPWRLQIYHNTTGSLVLSEVTQAEHRLVQH